MPMHAPGVPTLALAVEAAKRAQPAAEAGPQETPTLVNLLKQLLELLNVRLFPLRCSEGALPISELRHSRRHQCDGSPRQRFTKPKDDHCE